VLLWAQGLSGQNVSPSVVPSEDELNEALELGEIDFAQYQQLVEFALLGVSFGDPYLLEIIPNLTGLFIDPEAVVSDPEEPKPGRSTTISGRRRLGVLSQNWTEELETDSRMRYRSALILTPSPTWRADVRVYREYTGRERVVYRAVTFTPGKSPLESVTIGNYTARFGLGTIFGYRGKLLTFAPALKTESVLFPDYGGANGLLAKVRTGTMTATTAVSVQRDTHHQIVSSALQLSPFSRAGVPTLIAGYTTARNRSSGSVVRDLKLALFDELRSGRNRAAIEISSQFGWTRSWAAVAEGRYVGAGLDLTASAWAYGDRLATLTSGSKAGAISRTANLEEIGLTFCERRAGQEGAYVRSVSRFSEHWRLITAATFAGFDRSDYRIQWLPALVYDFSGRLEFRFDYQATLRHTMQSSATCEEWSSRRRAEVRFKSDNWNARSYIATTEPSTGAPYVSLLLQVTAQSADIGKIDGWLALDRIRQEQINYWYGYIRHRCRLFSTVELGMKLAHRFSRTAGTCNYTAVTLELTATY
jgi:hypothetical protein